MRNIFSRFIKKLRASAKGQSLVEMTVIAPIAIFLLIGVFEVGWALRGYVVLVNANRETTRFAVRPGYLDYSSPIKDVTTVGYDEVLTHANTSLASQLDLDFETNSKMIVSHIYVDTGLPCDPEAKPPKPCNCAAFVDPAQDYNIAQAYTSDDDIRYPTEDNAYYIQAFPAISFTEALTTSRINFAQEAIERARENNKFNCELLAKGGNPSVNNFIITEIFYEQPQLFGFPLISNPLTDPISLYSHTTMRLAAGARQENTDTVGPACDAFPFAVRDITLGWPDKTAKLNEEVDIFNGNSDYGGGSDFGWLAWNPDSASGSEASTYLRNELRSDTTAINDFTNAADPTDHTLTVGDWVAGIEGDHATAEASHNLVSSLLGRTIRIPVWGEFDTIDGRDAYKIVGFAWVKIVEGGINLPGKNVTAIYLGDASDACQDIPLPPSTGVLHVSDMVVTVDKSGNDFRATVVISVVDANGSPVKGATVKGDWSGKGSGSASGGTNSWGQVVFKTDWANGAKGSYTFCVSDITKSGWSYDAGANVETCDTGSS